MRSASRASRALFASLLVASSLLGAGATATLAQTVPGVGTEVPYVDEDGILRGTIKLSSVADPFTDNDPNSPPPTDSRYIGLVVAFTAADDQKFDTYPGSIALQDTTGTIWTPGYVPRPADAIVPDAQNQSMAPGNRLSGFIGYTVPTGVVIDQILYQSDYYRAIVLADLVPGGGPAAGQPVTYTRADGSQVAITAEITDPFTDNDPGSPPADGTRYVSVHASMDNTGDIRYAGDPYQIILHLDDGHLIFSTFVARAPDAPIPDFESQTMSPGDHISGLLNFVVPAASKVISVDYQAESNKRIILADLTAGAGPAGSPAPAPSEAPAPSVSPVPSAGTAQ